MARGVATTDDSCKGCTLQGAVLQRERADRLKVRHVDGITHVGAEGEQQVDMEQQLSLRLAQDEGLETESSRGGDIVRCRSIRGSAYGCVGHRASVSYPSKRGGRVSHGRGGNVRWEQHSADVVGSATRTGKWTAITRERMPPEGPDRRGSQIVTYKRTSVSNWRRAQKYTIHRRRWHEVPRVTVGCTHHLVRSAA